jgi:hypothetical protein
MKRNFVEDEVEDEDEDEDEDENENENENETNNPVCLALGDGLPTGRLNDSTTQRINSQRDAVTGRHGDQGKRGVEVEAESKIKDQTCLSGRQGKKIKGQD